MPNNPLILRPYEHTGPPITSLPLAGTRSPRSVAGNIVARAQHRTRSDSDRAELAAVEDAVAAAEVRADAMRVRALVAALRDGAAAPMTKLQSGGGGGGGGADYRVCRCALASADCMLLFAKV